MSKTTQIASPVANLQLYGHQPRTDLTAFDFQNNTYDFRYSPLVHDPFSWMSNLDWNLLRNLSRDTKDLIKLPYSSSSDYKALFYQTHEMTTVCPTADTGIYYAQYLVTLILNDMQPSSKTSLDKMHEWLRSVPQAAVLQFFKDLPTGHSDILRERVFAAAMRAGDEKTIRFMLALGLDPGEAIDIWSHDGQPAELPLLTALIMNRFPIAKVIMAQLCRTKTTQNLDYILDQVLNCYFERWMLSGRSQSPHGSTASDSDWSDIVRSLLDAGAKPTFQCFKFARNDPKLLGQALQRCEGNILEHIRANTLRRCIDEDSTKWYHGKRCEPLRGSVLSYFLQQMIHKIPRHDPTIIPVLWEALQSASLIRCSWAVDVILNAASLLGIELRHANYDDATNTAILSAHRDRDWLLIDKLIGEQSIKDAMVQCSDSKIWRVIEDTLDAALEAAKQARTGEGDQDPDESTADWNYLTNLLRTTEDVDQVVDFHGKIAKALSWGCDEIAIALCSYLDHTNLVQVEIVDMLEHNETAAISLILCQDQHWKTALLQACNQRNFEALDDLIHRTQTHQTEGASSLHWQMTLRVLSYHAIHSRDLSLLIWLLQTGLCTSDLSVTIGFRDEVLSLYELPSHVSFTGRCELVEDAWTCQLCSLLGVAASNNNALMVQFLLEEGVASGHSSALMLAVGANADEALLEMLLAASKNGRITRTRNFGASALRAAIFRKNYDVLRLLLDTVDIDGIDGLKIEAPQGSFQELNPLSPIGEAILRRDLKAADILIGKGANLNGLVAFDDYSNTGLNNGKGTVLKRASPLLAAIDTENLPMVQLLVEKGADIKQPSRMGLMRTPLQRAAEIGNFDIVQHLLKCRAPVDSTPCYNGGTPLQLAALAGHMGIASLLLENGANPNHLPAKGDGRTALEAAAEWSRTGMMSLLVSWGVNFNLIVDDKGHTQYERARGFAEKRGHMASKRFLERLWAESGSDSFDMQLFPPL
jgi:ankyrin repeat protein